MSSLLIIEQAIAGRGPEGSGVMTVVEAALRHFRGEVNVVLFQDRGATFRRFKRWEKDGQVTYLAIPALGRRTQFDSIAVFLSFWYWINSIKKMLDDDRTCWIFTCSLSLAVCLIMAGYAKRLIYNIPGLATPAEVGKVNHPIFHWAFQIVQTFAVNRARSVLISAPREESRARGYSSCSNVQHFISPICVPFDSELVPLDQEFTPELLSENIPRFFYFGRLEAVKNVDAIMGAVALFQEPRPLLIIAGEGAQQVYLEELANTLGLRRRSRFIGNRRIEEIWYLMKNTSVVVFASSREGISCAMLEASYAGVRVVSTPVAGLEDMDFGDRLTVAKGFGADALYHALQLALNKPASTNFQGIGRNPSDQWSQIYMLGSPI